MNHKILLLNGPNLNLLGTREPELYGYDNLNAINVRLEKQAKDSKFAFEALQSNAESILIERIHQAQNDGTSFILINPAAFTHTSIALRDALLAVGLPFIEIHLSNIYQREEFRKHSYFSDIAVGVISGFGSHGYSLAMQHALLLSCDKDI